MNNRSITAGLIIILGVLLIGAVKLWLPPCPGLIETAHGTHVPMKCFWTARMASGIGCFIIALGILLGMSRSPLPRVGLSLAAVAASVLLMAVPVQLIGVCGGEMMPCRVGTMPAILVISTLLFLIAGGNVIYLRTRPGFNEEMNK